VSIDSLAYLRDGPVMDRALIISYLQTAKQRLKTSERLILNQCKLIWSLERTGEDTTSAMAVFREMERRQLKYLADRERLLAELGLVDAGGGATTDRR
jgi:hypothetical protein